MNLNKIVKSKILMIWKVEKIMIH